MPPPQPLPLPPQFTDTDSYVSSLLSFSQDPLFHTLCGGVHILDFFTRDSSLYPPSLSTPLPQDLYHSILPSEWTSYFDSKTIHEVLELLMRQDLDDMDCGSGEGHRECPESLRAFIKQIRSHTLRREFTRKSTNNGKRSLGIGKKGGEWALNAGMRPKKIHEVENFSAYIDDLIADHSASNPTQNITHILDFGSGQAYLSRTLAKKYNHHVVGIESRTANIDGAREMDQRFESLTRKREQKKRETLLNTKEKSQDLRIEEDACAGIATKRLGEEEGGSLQYIEKRIEDGNLSEVVEEIQDLRISTPKSTNGSNMGTRETAGNHCNSNGSTGCVESNGCTNEDIGKDSKPKTQEKRLLLVSLHSCGNLVHHALKAFIATKEVKAVALIGCCYNLMTEKQGPTYKPPFEFRNNHHPRLLKTSASDPHGFPLSNLFTSHHISLNITARMMACQAPQNWNSSTSSAFFTRHFYRALLQRIFLDKGLIPPPSNNHEPGGSGPGSGGDPIIIGSLRKTSYTSFEAYVRGAISKLNWDSRISLSGQEIKDYETKYEKRKKDLSITWSLMAFCAGVVESLVVVDRWSFLKEFVDLGVLSGGCWVEVGFEYAQSPRNLVVVGIR